MLAFRSLDPFRALRDPDRRRRDEERLSRSEQRTLSKTQNNHLTGKAPYKFESPFLQQPVCLSGEPRGCKRKAPHFGGVLRAAGDVRTGVQAANRTPWPFLSVGH